MTTPVYAAEAEPRPPGHMTLHYRPADCAVGDVHPFFDSGTWHLFYERADAVAQSIPAEGCGMPAPGLDFTALAQLTDLLHWKESTVRHEAADRDDWYTLW